MTKQAKTVKDKFAELLLETVNLYCEDKCHSEKPCGDCDILIFENWLKKTFTARK